MTPSISKVKLQSIPPKTAGLIFEAQPMRSILSTRPMSAYISNATLPKQPPKSKALYDFTDQIQDLREKEVNLEKAKADFWLAAENQRHANTIADLQRQHEQQTALIKQQHEAQLKMILKEHSQECAKLESKCELLLKQANDYNQADREAFKAQIDHLKQEHSLQLQSQSQRNEQRNLQVQTDLREQLEQSRRDIEAQFKLKLKQAKAIQRQKMDQQVEGIVSKLSDESFEAMKQLREELKSTQAENVRLAFEFRDVQTRNRRQEDYIFELRQSLTEASKELSALKLPLVDDQKATAEVCTQTTTQTYNKETDVEGLLPVKTQDIMPSSVLSSEELQEVVEYQRNVIQKLQNEAVDIQLQQDHFFEAIKSKVLNIMRYSHTQLKSCKKEQMQERLQYEEVAYMLTMLQPKQRASREILKIQE